MKKKTELEKLEERRTQLNKELEQIRTRTRELHTKGLEKQHVGKFYFEHPKHFDPHYLLVSDVRTFPRQPSEFYCLDLYLTESFCSASAHWIDGTRMEDWVEVPEKHFMEIYKEVMRRMTIETDDKVRKNKK